MKRQRLKQKPKKKVKRVIKRPKLRHECLVREKEYASAFRLFIYDTHESMIAGMNKWCIENDYPDLVGDDDYTAICIGMKDFQKVTINKGQDNEEDLVVFAVCFMNLVEACLETIAHECVHQIIDCDRSVCLYVGGYGHRPDNGNDPEERLAYRMSDYFVGIVKAFEHIGHTLPLEYKYVEKD